MQKHFPFSHFPIPVSSIMWFKASYRHSAWEPVSRWDWHSVALARWFGFASEVFFSFPSSTRWDEQTLACKDLANMVFGEEDPADVGNGKTLILVWKFMWFCELNSSQTLGKEHSQGLLHPDVAWGSALPLQICCLLRSDSLCQQLRQGWACW